VLTRGYFNPYNIAQQGYVDPHSDYLTMTYQVGPIATLAYIALQVQVVRYALVVRKHSPDPWARHFGAYMVALCAAATLANCISNAFINRTTLGWYFWGLAGLVFAEHQALIRSGRIRGQLQPDPVKRAMGGRGYLKQRGQSPPSPGPEPPSIVPD
jgi:O-antigen ligase